MKTHAWAKELRQLADILESFPNTELSNLTTPLNNDKKTPEYLEKRQVLTATNLKIILELSQLNKNKWLKLIERYGFSIRVNSGDSLKNIVKKLGNYLEEHPEAVEVFKQKIKNADSELSVSMPLQTLLEFSQLSKQEWLDLINRYEFSIRITSKDSLENILKKLINHLEGYSVEVPREKMIDFDEEPSSLKQALDILLERQNAIS
ncbi:MAG: hypothetical protein ABFS56_34425 [Pseudomonadota bacterium]